VSSDLLGFDVTNPRFDGVDDVIRRRRSGRQPHDRYAVEPLDAKVPVGFDVMDAGALARAGLH
jgi:hypothetical protein